MDKLGSSPSDRAEVRHPPRPHRGWGAARQAQSDGSSGMSLRTSTAEQRDQNAAGRRPRRPRNRAGRGLAAWKRRRETPAAWSGAEYNLLTDLRRARRLLWLQGIDEPPTAARLTPGQRIADAVAPSWARGPSSVGVLAHRAFTGLSGRFGGLFRCSSSGI
jgi:hypothetical protein